MFFAVLRSLRAQHWKRCPAHRPLTRRHITSPSRKSGNEANRKSKTCTESSATFNSDVDWPLVRFWHPAVQPPLFLACTESFRQNEKLFSIRLKELAVLPEVSLPTGLGEIAELVQVKWSIHAREVFECMLACAMLRSIDAGRSAKKHAGIVHSTFLFVYIGCLV